MSNSFFHACSSLKRTCCVEWGLPNRKAARSKNYSYKYKADQILLFRIPLRQEARYLLVCSYIYQSETFRNFFSRPIEEKPNAINR